VVVLNDALELHPVGVVGVVDFLDEVAAEELGDPASVSAIVLVAVPGDPGVSLGVADDEPVDLGSEDAGEPLGHLAFFDGEMEFPAAVLPCLLDGLEDVLFPRAEGSVEDLLALLVFDRQFADAGAHIDPAVELFHRTLPPFLRHTALYAAGGASDLSVSLGTRNLVLPAPMGRYCHGGVPPSP
jgi:hypothetical protein